MCLVVLILICSFVLVLKIAKKGQANLGVQSQNLVMSLCTSGHQVNQFQ